MEGRKVSDNLRRLDCKNLSISLAPAAIDKLRVRILKDGIINTGAILYWMSRDQRVHDNWALLYAQEIALKLKRPLIVAFCLVPSFLNATFRQYAFMLKGLMSLRDELKKYNIEFYLLTGEPAKEIVTFIREKNVVLLITDFDPLRIKKQWKDSIKPAINIPFHEVDAHNIVPCWTASEKQEYGAYTFRPKILKILNRFLTEFPKLKVHPYNNAKHIKFSYHQLLDYTNVDKTVPEIDWLKPGENEAIALLKRFIKKRLYQYHLYRNDPTKDSQSDLSAYLHFGQISAQRVAIEVIKAEGIPDEAKNAFLEELIIRRELSDNFCFYSSSYDSIECAPLWARESIERHRRDQRRYIYNLEELEGAKTHDSLWNAAQMEMVIRGKMHGYLRMYWAKKILEWTESPEDALEICIYLNDKYELDGRDPNGYTGCAWSILGVHDRPWKERQVYGKIRYMSYQGSANKFDINAYIEKVNSLKTLNHKP